MQNQKGKKQSTKKQHSFEDKLKMITSMIEHLSQEEKKQFFAGLLPHVLSNDKLTKEIFDKPVASKQNIPFTPRKAEISEREMALIKELAEKMDELKYLIDLEELLKNP